MHRYIGGEIEVIALCVWSLLLLLVGALHPTIYDSLLLVGTLHPTIYDSLLLVGALHPPLTMAQMSVLR